MGKGAQQEGEMGDERRGAGNASVRGFVGKKLLGAISSVKGLIYYVEYLVWFLMEDTLLGSPLFRYRVPGRARLRYISCAGRDEAQLRCKYSAAAEALQ